MWGRLLTICLVLLAHALLPALALPLRHVPDLDGLSIRSTAASSGSTPRGLSQRDALGPLPEDSEIYIRVFTTWQRPSTLDELEKKARGLRDALATGQHFVFLDEPGKPPRTKMDFEKLKEELRKVEEDIKNLKEKAMDQTAQGNEKSVGIGGDAQAKITATKSGQSQDTVAEPHNRRRGTSPAMPEVKDNRSPVDKVADPANKRQRGPSPAMPGGNDGPEDKKTALRQSSRPPVQGDPQTKTKRSKRVTWAPGIQSGNEFIYWTPPNS